MNTIYELMQLMVRVFARIYSAIHCSQFAACGRDSRLGFGAKLDGARHIRVGNRVAIGKHAWLNAKNDAGDGQPSLTIGDGTYIGRLVQINAWRSVVIGRDVLIADRVVVTDADHRFDDPDVPIAQQGDHFVGPVVLCDGCWIGVGAVILPGVTVGRNSVVAANAVVTRDVPDRTIAAGIPAKIIKHIQADRARP